MTVSSVIEGENRRICALISVMEKGVERVSDENPKTKK